MLVIVSIMFDTVCFHCQRPINESTRTLLAEGGGVYRGDHNTPLNWFLKVSPDLDRLGYPRTSLFGEGPAGLIARGHNQVIEWVQASLPANRYCTNGELLRTPEEGVAALDCVHSSLNQISDPEIPVIEFTRADLVLHFRGSVDHFVAGHRHIRHPLIRNETVEYDGSGIVLPGRKAVIRIYDKLKEMGAGPGNIVRVEVELRKPKLAKLFGLADGEALRHLDFWKAYEVYRHIICQMRPQGVPDKLDFNRLLAECEAQGFRLSNGLTAMETYRACVDHKTYLDRRREIKGMVLMTTRIDWEHLLPVRRLPDDLPDAKLP